MLVRLRMFCVVIAVTLFHGLLISDAYGLAESIGPGGSNAKAVHELGIRGQAINVGLIGSKNIYTTHEAFYYKDSVYEQLGL